MVLSVFLAVIGLVTITAGFVGDFGNIRINEFVMFTGGGIFILSAIAAGLLVLLIVVDMIQNR